MTGLMNVFDGLKTLRNYHEMVKNVGRSETFMLNLINGPKRLKNHVHVHASKIKYAVEF